MWRPFTSLKVTLLKQVNFSRDYSATLQFFLFLTLKIPQHFILLPRYLVISMSQSTIYWSGSPLLKERVNTYDLNFCIRLSGFSFHPFSTITRSAWLIIYSIDSRQFLPSFTDLLPNFQIYLSNIFPSFLIELQNKFLRSLVEEPKNI